MTIQGYAEFSESRRLVESGAKPHDEFSSKVTSIMNQYQDELSKNGGGPIMDTIKAELRKLSDILSKKS